MARLEMQISALKCNAVNKEVDEAEENKEAKEKQMLLKILTSNGIEQKESLLNDLTAAESEVDQAAEDTRCQSSLL